MSRCAGPMHSIWGLGRCDPGPEGKDERMAYRRGRDPVCLEEVRGGEDPGQFLQ